MGVNQDDVSGSEGYEGDGEDERGADAGETASVADVCGGGGGVLLLGYWVGGWLTAGGLRASKT